MKKLLLILSGVLVGVVALAQFGPDRRTAFPTNTSPLSTDFLLISRPGGTQYNVAVGNLGSSSPGTIYTNSTAQVGVVDGSAIGSNITSLATTAGLAAGSYPLAGAAITGTLTNSTSGNAATVTSIAGNAAQVVSIMATNVAAERLPMILSNREPVRVILDQDFTTDEGDSHGLKHALALMDRNLIKVIAAGTTLTNEYSGAGVKAYVNYYGYPEIPVGVNRVMRYVLGSSVNGQHFSLGPVAQQASFPGYSLYNSNYPHAYKLYRKALVQSPDASVVMDIEGDSSNLAQLWDSPADEISPLTGQELCEQKLKYIFSNNGSTNSGVLEYNLTVDQTAATVWDRVTVPVVWMWWEVADGVGFVGSNVYNTDIHPIDSPIYVDATNYAYRTAGGDPWRAPWDGYAKSYIAAAQNIADGTNWIDGAPMFSIAGPIRMDYRGGGWIAISNTTFSGLPVNQYYIQRNGIQTNHAALIDTFIDAPPFRTGSKTNAPKDFKWQNHSMNAVGWGSGLLAAATGMTYSRQTYGGVNPKMVGVADWVYTDLGSRTFAISKNLPSTVTQAVAVVTLFAVTNDSYNFTAWDNPYFTSSGFVIGGTQAARAITNAYDNFYTVRWTNTWFGAGLTNTKQLRGYFDAQTITTGATGARYIVNFETGVKHSNEK